MRVRVADLHAEYVTQEIIIQGKLEALPSILEAEIGGDRESLLEVVVDTTLKRYCWWFFFRYFINPYPYTLFISLGGKYQTRP